LEEEKRGRLPVITAKQFISTYDHLVGGWPATVLVDFWRHKTAKRAPMLAEIIDVAIPTRNLNVMAKPKMQNCVGLLSKYFISSSRP